MENTLVKTPYNHMLSPRHIQDFYQPTHPLFPLTTPTFLPFILLGIVAPRREIAQYLRSRKHIGLARNIPFFEFIRAFAAIRGKTKRPASTASAHLRYSQERDRERGRGDGDRGRDRDRGRDDEDDREEGTGRDRPSRDASRGDRRGVLFENRDGR